MNISYNGCQSKDLVDIMVEMLANEKEQLAHPHA
jgi:hypothetical protein